MHDQRVSGSILNELHHRLDDLPKALGRIAQYVLTIPEKVVHQSIAELSEHAGSGQASVIRLVKSLGFDGFSDFKTALTIELSRRPIVVSGEGSPLQHLTESLAEQTIADASETARLIGSSGIADVVEKILQSDQVWIFGSGVSGLCGELLQYRLVRLGFAATAISDPIVARELASSLRAPAVAIAISDSGSTPYAVGFLREAAQVGAFTVAISSRSNSALSDEANVLLQTGSTGGADKAGNILGVVGRAAHVIETLGQSIELARHPPLL